VKFEEVRAPARWASINCWIAGFADADQRELGRGEEGIDRHQEQDDEHPQQHVRNHGTLILTFKGIIARESAFRNPIRGFWHSLQYNPVNPCALDEREMMFAK